MSGVDDVIIDESIAPQDNRGIIAAPLPDHPLLHIPFGRELDKMEVALLTPPKAV